VNANVNANKTAGNQSEATIAINPRQEQIPEAVERCARGTKLRAVARSQ
jgi:hypothetical protein